MQKDPYTRSSFQHALCLWILPLVFLTGGCALVYVLTGYFNLSGYDRICGFGLVLAFFSYRRFSMGIKWLKRPGGGYFYVGEIKGDDTDITSAFAEPAFYEKEFRYAWSKQFLSIFLGLFCIALSWTFLSKTTVILPFTIFLAGLLFLRKSFNAMRSGPVIKLAKEGIWTKDSAYLPWDRIETIRIAEMPVDDSVYHYLEIFLKDDGNNTFPDYKLPIDELAGSEEIEQIIASFKSRSTC